MDGKEDESKSRLNSWKLKLKMWIYSCVEVIWVLIDENKCCVFFYVLLYDKI